MLGAMRETIRDLDAELQKDELSSFFLSGWCLKNEHCRFSVFSTSLINTKGFIKVLSFICEGAMRVPIRDLDAELQKDDVSLYVLLCSR